MAKTCNDERFKQTFSWGGDSQMNASMLNLNCTDEPSIVALGESETEYTVFHHENGNWLIRIDHFKGIIEVNQEDFPEMAPSDFVKEFIRLLNGSGLV